MICNKWWKIISKFLDQRIFLILRQRNLSLFFTITIINPVYGSFKSNGRNFTTEDLIGKSLPCNVANINNPEIKKCNLRSDSIEPLQDIQVKFIHQAGVNFSKQLKDHYYSKTKNAMNTRYALASWLSDKNPLSGPDGKYVSKSLDRVSQNCLDEENESQENSLKSKLQNIDSIKTLGFENKSVETLEKEKEQTLKRMFIAWIEINRIDRLISSHPLSDLELKELKTRREKVLSTYPITSESRDGYLLRQLSQNNYQEIEDADSNISHPNIDQILFPSENKKTPFLVDSAVNFNRKHEGLVNSILKKPLPKRIKEEIQSLIASSISNNLDSISSLCSLNPCQLMQLDLKNTAKQLTDLPSYDKNISLKAICSCDLKTPTEYVSSKSQLIMVGATIAGIISCPFTYGLGCYAAAASGAVLSVASAANTVGAIEDFNQFSAMEKATSNLPGFSTKKRKIISNESNDAANRVIINATGTVLGGAPGPKLIKQGTSILKNPETFRPIAKATVTGEDLFKATKSDIKNLNKMGVKFEKDPNRMTSVEGNVKLWPDDINYSTGNIPVDHYGEILKITKLPKPASSGGPFTNALEHPEMQLYLEKMKNMGIDLVVDTSIKKTNVGAYYWSNTKVIALRTDSSWQTFIHEFQHAQFDKFIQPKIGQLKDAIQYEGKNIRDVLPRNAVSEYGEKEISRLEKLIQNGNTTRGMNETMSTSREMDALGWKQYVPGLNSPRIYGANHRVNSLAELQQNGYKLTETQLKTLSQGKAEVMLLNAYNLAGTVAAPIAISKALDGTYQIYNDLNIIYNERTGDVIAKSPRGNVFRVQMPSSNTENEK